MKKMFLAFSLGLILLFGLNACDCGCDSYKGPFFIEALNNQALILKDDNSENRYENPQNIFLGQPEVDRYENVVTWYRKVGKTYQKISVDWSNSHSLSTGAYTVCDTISDVEYSLIAGHLGKFISAYQNPGKEQLIDRKISRVFSGKFLTAEIETTTANLLVIYDKETKIFSTLRLAPKKEISKNYAPLIFLLLFFLITLIIVFKRIKINNSDDNLNIVNLALMLTTFAATLYDAHWMHESGWFESIIYAILFSGFTLICFTIRKVDDEIQSRKILSILAVAFVGAIQLFFFRGFSIWLMLLFGAILSIPVLLVISKESYKKFWDEIIYIKYLATKKK